MSAHKVEIQWLYITYIYDFVEMKEYFTPKYDKRRTYVSNIYIDVTKQTVHTDSSSSGYYRVRYGKSLEEMILQKYMDYIFYKELELELTR